MDFAQPSDHLKKVTVNGHTLASRVQNGHVVLPPSDLTAGDNVVDIDFIAGDESLNRNDDYMYTLFVPARASLAMPCFDQPDLKARWRLSLELPADWVAVSNGRETGRTASAEHLGLIFDETQPIPTYLFAFAAGKFSIETAEREGRTFRMFHRETDAAKVARNRDGDLRSARARARMARGLHDDSVSLRQVRLRADSRIPVRRDGAPGRDLLQRRRADARRVGHAEPAARTRQYDLARDVAHVVRRFRDDEVVQRRVDEGGLRELHGGEDRQSDVPGRQPRPPVPVPELSGRVRRGSHGRRQPDSPGARQPRRGRLALRRHHLSEGAGRHAPARIAHGPGRVPRRAARVPQGARVR